MVDIVTKQEASRNTKDRCGIPDRQERLVNLDESASRNLVTHIWSTLRHDVTGCAFFIRGICDQAGKIPSNQGDSERRLPRLARFLTSEDHAGYLPVELWCRMTAIGIRRTISAKVLWTPSKCHNRLTAFSRHYMRRHRKLSRALTVGHKAIVVSRFRRVRVGHDRSVWLIETSSFFILQQLAYYVVDILPDAHPAADEEFQWKRSNQLRVA